MPRPRHPSRAPQGLSRGPQGGPAGKSTRRPVRRSSTPWHASPQSGESRDDRCIHNPQALHPLDAAVLIHHRHRVRIWPHLTRPGHVPGRARCGESNGQTRLRRPGPRPKAGGGGRTRLYTPWIPAVAAPSAPVPHATEVVGMLEIAIIRRLHCGVCGGQAHVARAVGQASVHAIRATRSGGTSFARYLVRPPARARAVDRPRGWCVVPCH